jgi:hypothetical protein
MMKMCARGFPLGVLLCAVFCGATPAGAQEPPAPPQPPAESPVPPPAKPQQKHYTHKDDFLIRGTVFDDKALSLPGVELRIHRTSEKKYRWETYTNSRGEFAVRVPQGSQYELVVRAKGFAEQKKTVDATVGAGELNMALRLELTASNKAKEKK